MKFVISVITLIFVLYCSADEIRERPCNLAFKCSLQDDPVWCTDGKQCYVFRNACHLANENCHRQNLYEPVYEVTTRENCQALCNPMCTRIKKPVCGYYNDLKREFSNKCMMDYHICQTGKTFMVYNEGKCEEPLSLSEP